VLEAVQNRLDKNPHAMRQRRETAEHPFGMIRRSLLVVQRCLIAQL
jgi:hypothetical protein